MAHTGGVQSTSKRLQLPEGGILKRDWLKYYQPHEIQSLDELDIYQAWDLAIFQEETADYTVCTIIGVEDDNKIYVLDWYQDRIDFPTQIRIVEKLAQKYDPLQIGIESNAYIDMTPLYNS